MPRQTIRRNGTTYRKELETSDFVYYVNETSEAVIMFRKSNMELISNNWLAENDLIGRLIDKDYTWISEQAKQAAIYYQSN